MTSNLISGEGWYAAVEGWAKDDHLNGRYAAPEDDQATLRYCKVIAWEQVLDADGRPELRAWLNGRPPVASDHWGKSCNTHFINHYTDRLPEDPRFFSWA